MAKSRQQGKPEKGLRFPTGGLIMVLSFVRSAADEARDRDEGILYNTAECRVIGRLGTRVAQGYVSGSEIINRVANGMPGDGRTEEELAVSETRLATA